MDRTFTWPLAALDPAITQEVERWMANLPRSGGPAGLGGRGGGAPRPPEHLQILDHLGTGGMGEVWRAREARMDRDVALKAVRATPHLQAHAPLLILEALLTARLRHPGIPAVFERGLLLDGRPYYTMPVYLGRTLRTALREQTGVTRTRAQLTQMVDIVQRAAEAVARAHASAIAHLDLKPENVYLGVDGEVVVLDWGIALSLSRAGALDDTTPAARGTRGYMPEEQRTGDVTRMGPTCDVWALGRILGECVAAGRAGEEDLSVERRALALVIDRACASDPGHRYADAAALVGALREWRGMVDRRVLALAAVEDADRCERRESEMRACSARAAERAETLARAVHAWQPVEAKQELWQAEDERDGLQREAELLMVERDRLLAAALTYDAEMPEAHTRLAARYRALHAEAEGRKDGPAAARWEVLLRAHDRGEHASYLRGEGAITLVTDPPGATATLYRYENQDRRLVPRLVRPLGETPLFEVPVPHGSWLVELEAPGRAVVRHPILVRRSEHVDGVAPGEAAPRAIELPPWDELGPDDCIVTPGWALVGGDPHAPAQAPTGRVWIEQFLLRRFPVTNLEFLGFLNDLAARGELASAMRLAPREKGPSYERPGSQLYGWDGQRFALVPDGEGHLWDGDWPVMMIVAEAALAFAAWTAAQSGRPWRLPREDEWERAARGADGRFFPWGDHLDPTWACHIASWEPGARILPVPVHSYPADTSPFGVRGLAGGMRDLCQNVWGAPTAALDGYPALRGGAWNSPPQIPRAAMRMVTDPRDPHSSVGFRLARSMGRPTAGRR